MGYSMVAVVSISIIYNVALIAYDSVKKGIHDFKIYMMIKKIKKQIKERKPIVKDVVLVNMKNNRIVDTHDLEKGHTNIL